MNYPQVLMPNRDGLGFESGAALMSTCLWEDSQRRESMVLGGG